MSCAGASGQARRPTSAPRLTAACARRVAAPGGRYDSDISPRAVAGPPVRYDESECGRPGNARASGRGVYATRIEGATDRDATREHEKREIRGLQFGTPFPPSHPQTSFPVRKRVNQLGCADLTAALIMVGCRSGARRPTPPEAPTTLQVLPGRGDGFRRVVRHRDGGCPQLALPSVRAELAD